MLLLTIRLEVFPQEITPDLFDRNTAGLECIWISLLIGIPHLKPLPILQLLIQGIVGDQLEQVSQNVRVGHNI